MEAIALESQNALAHDDVLEPNLREDVSQILEEFQKARHLVRIQFLDPTSDL